MTAQQRILRVRRQYNQWVANQTLEDYALRFTAKSARRWASFRVANTAIGSIAFLALEAIGGTVTLDFGFTNAAYAFVTVCTLLMLTGLPIAYYAAKHGVDIDLLTRGAGFGYIGSTVTSLIYASFTFIFFAIEGSIMSTALKLCFGIPLPIAYVISALVVIPLVTHGFTFISRFQMWTQGVWIVLQIAPFAYLIAVNRTDVDGWTSTGPSADTFDLTLFGGAVAVVLSLIAQIGEQIDVLRFLPPQEEVGRTKWWLAVFSAGPGWVILGILKLFAGSLLAFVALQHGIPASDAGDPSHMYVVAFSRMIHQPNIAVGIAGIFVVLSQMKINVTNAYAGSIAWSNFFSRLTHNHPGRVVWLLFNVAIALALMEFGLYQALGKVLSVYSVVTIAWVGTIVADLVINKPLGLSPAHIEFRRAHLYDINPVGLGSMGMAIIVALFAHAGTLGAVARALAPFIALGIPFVAAPLLAFLTHSRYYLARTADLETKSNAPLVCCICEYSFEPEDMAQCPAYGGPICSLCCSLDVRCHDRCKTGARMADQILALADAIFPKAFVAKLNSRLGHYLSVLLITYAVIGLLLVLIYYLQVTLSSGDASGTVRDVLWEIFAAMVIIAGVAVWLFVLVQESRRIAQDELNRQTALLMSEIEAHQQTDLALQKAKEVAELANLAKSRYIVGMSHELRSPLNTIFGYAQLLERDEAIPPHRQDTIKVIRRSSEHLAGLIEGLLDISKIESGRLQLQRDEVWLNDFLHQIVDMFRLQAEAKGLEFIFESSSNLPAVIHSDEKRLRQVLINLLSNAIKFTEKGRVTLRVRCPGQVTEFEVEDTGIGIIPDDIERIFEPFERGEDAAVRSTPGTGLGLTITNLLTRIMGGQIHVTSLPGIGSRFQVRLLLSEVLNPAQKVPAKSQIRGYSGRRLTVLVADDDAHHRALISDVLSPLGFIVFGAPNGRTCLDLADEFRPDLFLLDISMPDMTGWQVARKLRETGYAEAVIIMISANAQEYYPGRNHGNYHDDFLVKPIDIVALTERIGQFFRLEWLYLPSSLGGLLPTPSVPDWELLPSSRDLDELIQIIEIGHVRGFRAKLETLERETPALRPFVAKMRSLAESFELDRLLDTLRGLRGECEEA